MRKIIVAIGLIISNVAISSPPSLDSYWQDIQNTSEMQKSQQAKGLERFRSLILDEQGLRNILFESAITVSSHPLSQLDNKKTKSLPIEIDLPLPNARFIRVWAMESSVLSPEVAEQYPHIKTWRVVGVDNPEVTGRLDFTPKGFHGMLNMPDGDTVFIDPEKNSSTSLYHSLSKHDNAWRFNKKPICKVQHKHSLLDNSKTKNLSAKKLSQIPTSELITYRLVVAGTAEYTQSQGGTASAAFSSIVTTINRVNDIYQRDLGIKLEIVSGKSFAYTNSFTDPYTNDNAESLVFENIKHINETFGVENYDIGHVFAAGELGGLSYVGAVCQDDYKAGSATGTPDPQGEIFSIEFVAHEMGHQFGATHSFNSEEKGCSGENRAKETAVEPGSGSTIMSYAGLCGSDNLQLDSDAIFHSVNINQINNYTRSKEGSRCGLRQSNSHSPTAKTKSNSVIPKNTPFFLSGSSTGGNLYSWEQIDSGAASPVDIDKANNAIIRVLPLSSSKERYIPRLSDLFAGTQTKGEILPQTIRDLNFAFIARDGNGGIGSDLKEIQVRDTGGTFKVLSQSTSQTLSREQDIRIDWDVAGTNDSPINCKKVDIQLLRESGIKHMLLANTDNDGRQQLIIPAETPIIANARIMVACYSQPFFQISAGAIAIQEKIEKHDSTGSPQDSSSGGAIGFLLLLVSLVTVRKKYILSKHVKIRGAVC